MNFVVDASEFRMGIPPNSVTIPASWASNTLTMTGIPGQAAKAVLASLARRIEEELADVREQARAAAEMATGAQVASEAAVTFLQLGLARTRAGMS